LVLARVDMVPPAPQSQPSALGGIMHADQVSAYLPQVPQDVPRDVTLRLSDRLAPARRPDKKVVAYQDWRNLLFLHWPVAPQAIEPLLPAGVELDLFRGRAWVSIVPFEGRRSRLAGIGAGFSLDFLEINVRTYVHCKGVPGVFVFSMDASSHLAVAFSRVAVGLPYSFASIDNLVQGKDVEYRGVRHASHRPTFATRAQIGDAIGLSRPGTLDHFLLERYVLFIKRLGGVYATRIHHAPLLARQAVVTEVDDELIPAAGMPGYAHAPPVAYFVAGADVEFFAPERVKFQGQ
jgi:uncharacterized protein YqjF (DUF2071 family)